MSDVRSVLRVASALAASLVLLGASAPAPVYPPTKTVPVADTYFGTRVADPYRWLEDPKDPGVIAWAAAETKTALGAIESSPAYATYAPRVAALSRTSTARFGLAMRGGRLFYLRQTPPEQQPALVVRDGLAGVERVLFDPKEAEVDGGEPAIETVAVSDDGSKVAFTTQLGGSENETIHVVDAAAGTMLPDTIAHAGGGTSPVALAWDGDSKGFLHTRLPENPDGTFATSGMRIFHHVLGADPASDPYVFGKDQSPKVEYAIRASLDGRATAIVAADGDGVHASVYMRGGTAPFALVAGPAAGIGNSADAGGAFVGDAFYAIAHERDSRGEVVALTPGGAYDTAKVIVPASGVVIEGVAPYAGGFATSDVDGGDGGARLFTIDGTPRERLPVPPVSTLTELESDPSGGPIVFGYFGYTSPDRWLAYDPATRAASETGIAQRSPGDFSDVVAERVFVRSRDGKVEIPLEIVREKTTKLDGTAPAILAAYGAYGTISRPFFRSSSLAWLERGGIFAQAMIRGGGEYGESWHEAARLSTKTVSADDLAACAGWLATDHYTSASHLGILGGSAGGFLMGLALTRDPSLYGAVVAQVGILDLLRVELSPNGAFNTPEFGTVTDPAQFAWMLKQSPYHNVRRGTAYPAVLMTTGENDPRVDPMNSRKMTAMLQADTASTRPVYLIQRAGQGHGIGNSFDQRVRETTDVYAFFDMQLR